LGIGVRSMESIRKVEGGERLEALQKALVGVKSSRKKILLSIILLSVLAFSVTLYETKQSFVNANSKTVRVLFIGNSYTSVNNLPRIVSRIAKSVGDHLEYDISAPGSYTFKAHTQNQNTLQKIISQKWDAVVLQEQSLFSALSDDQVSQQVEPYALQLVKIVHDSNPQARIVFFETWGRKNGDSGFCKTSPTFCSYESMQSQINITYKKLALDAPGELAPVGETWSQTRKAHPEIELFRNDGSHPTSEGTYLSACVFYKILFGKRVIGASHLNINSSYAKTLREIAEQTVSLGELKQQ
jgi:uncharacterized protein DUF4886